MSWILADLMNWRLIANPYPYDPRPDYFSMGITVLALIFIIVGTWKIYKSGKKEEKGI